MNNPAARTTMATYYASQAPYTAVYTTAPSGGTPGTEPTGGSPAYARKASNWGTAAAGAVTADPVAHDIPSGASVNGAGFHSAVTAGTYWDGGTLPTQAFASQGTYKVTATYTQT